MNKEYNRNKFFCLLFSMLENDNKSQVFEAFAMIDEYKNDFKEGRMNLSQRNHLITQLVYNYFQLQIRIKNGDIPDFMSLRFYSNELNFEESDYV